MYRKINISNNIAIFNFFLTKICHKLDKNLPYTLQSIWQLCCTLPLYYRTIPEVIYSVAQKSIKGRWIACPMTSFTGSLHESSTSRFHRDTGIGFCNSSVVRNHQASYHQLFQDISEQN